VGDFLEAVNQLKDTSIPAILAIAGLFFILLAFVGRIAGRIELPRERQVWAGIIGILLLLSGISLSILPVLLPAPIPPAADLAEAGASTIPPTAPVDTPASQPPATSPVSAQASEPSPAPSPEAQTVLWGPSMQPKRVAGICINDCADFVFWNQLKEEIRQEVLPRISDIPGGSTLQLGAWQGNEDWIVRVVSPDGREIAHIWFGPDPSDVNWRTFDGLVRVGYPSVPVDVWCTFQRYSDGSYRTLKCD
jgi:hypothetical protein